ncbi:hypothetical protein SUDANB146_06239 [Streptomyces sp. enrichment culture]
MQSIQFTGPCPSLGNVPTHAQDNDRAGLPSRQAPLQYWLPGPAR